MVSKSFVMIISACDNSTRVGKAEDDQCHSLEQINEYIEDVQVDTWNIHEGVNFEKYYEKKSSVDCDFDSCHWIGCCDRSRVYLHIPYSKQ